MDGIKVIGDEVGLWGGVEGGDLARICLAKRTQTILFVLQASEKTLGVAETW